MNDRTTAPAPPHSDWPALPWILAAVGALAGFAVYRLLDGPGSDIAWRVGLAAFVLFGALAICFAIVKERLGEALLFAGAVALVLGGLAFHITRSGEALAGPQYTFGAGVLAFVLALPLFQAGFLRTRFATPYGRVHFHVWTDAVASVAAGGFALLSFAMLWLIHLLLSLVDIELLGDLIERGWLAPTWLAGSFGAALGVLRDNFRVIGALQQVALLVLALLAVPLALALLVFLTALALSGGEALWEATDNATPVLLVCAAGCWVLANAVIRDDDAARSRSRVMQAAALVLALGILPLALFAALSMGLRIGQHGLAPERMWGLVATAVAVAFGLGCLVAVLRGRRGGWAEGLRAANLRLATGVCVLALVLALPVVDFGAIAARSQLARLERGAVSVEQFDFAALRWDFGAAGRRALERLGERGGEVGELAQGALALTQRDFARPVDLDLNEARRTNLRVQSEDPAWQRRIRAHFLAMQWACTGPCVAVDLGPGERDTRHVKLVEVQGVTDWMIEAGPAAGGEPATARSPEATRLRTDSTVEVRRVEGRQIYVDGQPVGEPFR